MAKEQNSTYEGAGVNIELGDDASKILYNAARQTWDNRKGNLGELIVPFDDFSGVRAIDVGGLPKGSMMNMGFDGVGTKMEIAERTGNYSSVAYDLFAMVCDDAVIRGAEPVLIGSILDVNSLGKNGEDYIEQVKQLATGYINAAQDANVAIVNGEIAELGNRINGYGPFNSNWGASVVWFANKDKMFTGRDVKAGDYLVGLREEGFRSNGLSLVRKIMEDNYGEKWHMEYLGNRKKTEKRFGELALMPSRIYTGEMVKMFGGFKGQEKAKIHGAAHITGGGIPGKLGRMLKPTRLGAIIDNPYFPSDFMLHLQLIGGVSDKEAYKTWNMGQGMIIATPEPYKVIGIAKEAKIIGKVTSQPGAIIIKNKGLNSSKGEELIFSGFD
jgi:phosphoribosylformylglycinamidine cyclo-ligase